ncbi:MAG: ABC transporter substrate-binding protein [Candidatus Omnitrophota bacterium]
MRLGFVLTALGIVSYCSSVMAVSVEDAGQAVLSLDQKVHSNFGGTLVWGTVNPPVVINPILINQGVSSAIFSLVFDALVRVNAGGDIVPGLASSWDISADGLSYVFHLKKGVRFHDGVELTAEDVKFTYDAMADPRNNSPRKDVIVLSAGAQWQVIDKYTIRLSLKQPSPHFLYKLMFEIVPKHVLEGKDLSEAVFNIFPIGTGPFRFTKWDRLTQEIVLEANHEYFDGRPYLDRIVIKVYPDNTSLWAALMRQEVDFIKFLNREDYEVLRKDPVFKTYEIAAGMSMAIVFDVKDPIFSDVRVRRAVALGINVNQMMDEMRVGGVRSTGIFAMNSAGFNPDVVALAYNPQDARRMLGAAGWRDVDADGLLEKDGVPLEMRLLVDARSGYFETAAMIIRQRLSEIGIKLTVLLYQDEKEFTPEYLSKNKPQAWLRLFYMFDRDPGMALEQWYPSGDELERLWHYQNPQLDDLINKARHLSDKALLAKVYQQIHKIVYDDQPACFLFSFVTRHAVARKFLNTDGFFFPLMPAYMMKDWYLAKTPFEKE